MTRNKLSIDIPKLDESRGVSPVIGVILMVAITIILAAVIGAFVLGFGADTEAAPTASFSGDQEDDPFEEENGDNGQAWTVTFTHEGGSSVDADNLAVAFPDTDGLDRNESPDISPDTVRAGDTVSVDLQADLESGDEVEVADNDRAQLVWESGDTTSVLRTYNMNTDGESIELPAPAQ